MTQLLLNNGFEFYRLVIWRHLVCGWSNYSNIDFIGKTKSIYQIILKKFQVIPRLYHFIVQEDLCLEELFLTQVCKFFKDCSFKLLEFELRIVKLLYEFQVPQRIYCKNWIKWTIEWLNKCLKSRKILIV